MIEDYEFEWDDVKNASNLRKHNVSFEDARAIWDDPFAVEVHLTTEPEDRWAVIGRIAKGQHLIAVITYREERVRIISARRATKKEAKIYESY